MQSYTYLCFATKYLFNSGVPKQYGLDNGGPN